jgi:hypothetical protein
LNTTADTNRAAATHTAITARDLLFIGSSGIM